MTCRSFATWQPDWRAVSGRLVEIADTQGPLQGAAHPYTRMLLDAVPDLEMTGPPAQPVEGEIPNPINPPSGCTFHPRCPFANDRCKREVPLWTQTRTGVAACHGVEEGRIPSAEMA
jgi:peptide/nickel transport system ATP-binding protein